ncbi:MULTISPECIES: OB-fold domain-containing protein [unclassified Micromonospora]|uniref:Zn-ribbon domain-containing OB-fold protein n=1 Tax=unclassified Micromonospora TaxID=2617518 RepID=UPI0033A64985
MEITALSVYRPAWADARGRRMLGPDEDVTTLAVAAATGLGGEALVAVARVVLVTRRPDATLGTFPEIVLQALGLDPATPVEERLGGAPSTLDALLSAAPGTLVIGVDPAAPAAAGAALTGPGGLSLERADTVRHSVPVRTRATGDATDRVYDDPRLLRERGWRRALPGAGEATVVAGLPDRDVRKLAEGAHGVPDAQEAAAPIFALARGPGLLVAVENGHSVSARVTGDAPCTVTARTPHTAPETWAPRTPAEIPASLASYERALEAKVGLKAGECRDCGERSLPPRTRCLHCGGMDTQDLVALPRSGEVYSIVTIHATVPGKHGPYSLAVVGLAGTSLRTLAHVTDAEAGSARIGDPGALVLRCVAVRAGVPDYGYAFQPEEQP